MTASRSIMAQRAQARPTVAEIDEGALAANFRALAALAGGPTRVLPVVKADAYGHGAETAARVLGGVGAVRFAVATVAEAERLRRAAIRDPIVVLGGAYPDEHATVAAAALTPVVWEAETAAGLGQAARARGTVVPVHVKVDTGMTRLGAAPSETAALLTALGRIEGLEVEGLLTHFCDAENLHAPHTARQLATFAGLVRELRAAGICPPMVHAANSAATMTEPAAHFDLVRPGLALYGVYPSPAARARATLRPVMRLVTRVILVHTVPAGVGVSYGATFVTARASRIAVLPLGYADGYPRALSNCGVARIGGALVPVAGRVCMDHTMLDVTAAGDVTVGAEVELWGAGLPVEDVAERARTIPYELLSRVGARVPRVPRTGNGGVDATD